MVLPLHSPACAPEPTRFPRGCSADRRFPIAWQITMRQLICRAASRKREPNLSDGAFVSIIVPDERAPRKAARKSSEASSNGAGTENNLDNKTC
jgi:hypothetical protein